MQHTGCKLLKRTHTHITSSESLALAACMHHTAWEWTSEAPAGAWIIVTTMINTRILTIHHLHPAVLSSASFATFARHHPLLPLHFHPQCHQDPTCLYPIIRQIMGA